MVGGCVSFSHGGQATRLLEVDATGLVSREALEGYMGIRRNEVAKLLQSAFACSPPVRNWFELLGKQHEEGRYVEMYEEGRYSGNESGEAQAVDALQRAKRILVSKETVAVEEFIPLVIAMEEFIIYFCGFNAVKAVCIVNALHFQFSVDIQRFLDAQLTAPSAIKESSAADRALFDQSEIASAELLLRVIVEKDDGTLVANPCSPGRPMGGLSKLPVFAQLVMVLTNAVEAKWYQQEIPDCPLAINLYASLLVENAPLQQMTEHVQVVEIMEMTKGAQRSDAVVDGVRWLREQGKLVLLDDFDSKHPAFQSSPHGIKISVMANASHALQVLKEDGAPTLMPLASEKAEVKDSNYRDFYCSSVPRHQPNIKFVVMEGSENCIRSEVKGPPLNFGEMRATLATAHLYKAAIMALCTMQPDLKMYQQGGRALYADEVFDPEALSVLARLDKQEKVARVSEAGTMAWMGQEAVRRAAMKFRPFVCGVGKVETAHLPPCRYDFAVGIPDGANLCLCAS